MSFPDWLLGLFCVLFSESRATETISGPAKMPEMSAQSNFYSQYSSGDNRLIHRFGVVSGLLSVVVLVFYIYGNQAMMFYGTPNLLWLLCPILLFWIFRLWAFAQQNRIGADLIIYVFRDPFTYLLTVASLIVLWAAA